ncbi:MAG TPA: hypothetical protein VJ204_08690 [Solirubrobacterales bacterium]|nr:hypothetical protein [Solirubrobacterales bacterium]
MGMFNAQPQLDQKFVEAIIADGDRSRRSIEKAAAKNQGAIPSLMEEGESLAAITHGEGANEILLITNRRLLRVKRGKLSWRAIPLGEVFESNVSFRDLGGGTVKYMLVVETFTSKEYAEGDQRRYLPDHFLLVDYGNPREAKAVCSIIDLMKGQLG